MTQALPAQPAQVRGHRAGIGRKKALVFLDYDLLIRHFILTGAFRELEEEFDVGYVFSTGRDSDKPTIFTDVRSLGLERTIVLDIPRSRMGAWYQLYCMTVLHLQRGKPNYEARRELMRTIVGERELRKLVLRSLPGIYHLSRAIITRRMGVYEPLARLLDDERPDVILHPSILTGFFINELLLLTRERGIPFVVLMNSWDNPTSKAMLTGHPDRLVVWGEVSRQYAIEYLSIPPDRVVAFGAAQFERYRVPPRASDAEIRTKFGLPRGRKVILYAGASKGAHETTYLQMLEEGIESGRIPECHVVYRPHPWRGGLAEGEEDFFSLEWKHISMDPHMADYYRREVAQASRGFYMADYQALHELLHISEGVISPLSTTLLEATILGKPSIMFFPDSAAIDPGGRVTGVGLKMVHFTDFWGVEGVQVCERADQFYDACRLMLRQASDPRVAERLRQHASRFVVMSGPSYAERILDLALELTGGRIVVHS